MTSLLMTPLIKKEDIGLGMFLAKLLTKHFKNKKIGKCDSLQGRLDDVPYDIFCMREPDYVMKIMSTYGGLTVQEDQRDSIRAYYENGEIKNCTFKYMIPFANHFLYRHMVNDHNSIQHQVPSLEQTWTTHRWANRVFAFLLALSEVNSYLALRYFVWKGEEKMQFMEFPSKLGWELINNQYLDEEEDNGERKSKRRRAGNHDLEKAPPHAKIWMGGRWDLTAKQRYQQYRCRGKGCKQAIRTYCSCAVGVWLCHNCHVIHCFEMSN